MVIIAIINQIIILFGVEKGVVIIIATTVNIFLAFIGSAIIDIEFRDGIDNLYDELYEN